MLKELLEHNQQKIATGESHVSEDLQSIISIAIDDLVDRHGGRLFGIRISRTLSGMRRISHLQVRGDLSVKRETSNFSLSSYTSYHCTGDVTEWTKCSYSTRAPTRKAFVIPEDIKQEYDALFVEFISSIDRDFLFSKSYKYKKRDRILAKVVEKQATISKTPDVSRVIQE